MHLKAILKVIATLLLTVAVAGCGSGNSNTNGTLTLNDQGTGPSNGVVNLTVTAILTPAQVGSTISFSAQMYNAGGSLGATYACYGNRSTDVTGTAPFSCNILQPTVNATLEVNATSDGLPAIPLRISIPAFVAP